MEIPIVNRIADFEVTTTSLPIPPSFSISGFEKVYSIWTWGALILAVIASFGTIITRINFIIIRRLRHKTTTTEPLSLSVNEEDDFSDIDDDDDSYSVSTSSSLSDDEDDDEKEDEDYNVRGSGLGQKSNLRLRRGRSFGGMNRFSWSDFASGKSVVKLWDNLALGLDLDDDDSDDDDDRRRIVSIYDVDKQKKINTFYAGTSFQIPAAATSSRSTILSADSRASLSAWDTRDGSKIPAMMAEWGPQIGRRIVGVASGGVDNKVYVKDGVTGKVTAGDMRKLGAPLLDLTDADVSDTWWDADAVVVSDYREGESAAANGCDSAVTRCCSAVRSYLL